MWFNSGPSRNTGDSNLSISTIERHDGKKYHRTILNIKQKYKSEKIELFPSCSVDPEYRLISREDAKEIIEVLQHFVDTGKLPESPYVL